MKKKLEEAYIPKKVSGKERIVVGLSGGMYSFVTAYLLKIQKYDLLGVTVETGWDDYKGDESKVLSCHLNKNKIEQIKEFCHQLSIPHFSVKASDAFKEEVVEKWMNAKITGTKSNQCWSCHNLRMELLYKKMLELEADGVATGHLAKIFHHESHQSVYFHTSNDEVHDQSVLLSRLPNEIINKLILPLSDLTHKEILKLAENFGLEPNEAANQDQDQDQQCFSNNTHIQEYLAQHVPKKYQNPGEILNLEKKVIGNHEGIIHLNYGEPISVGSSKNKESLFLSHYSMMTREITLKGKDFFKRKSFFLNNCSVSQETSWMEPFKGVVKLKDGQFAECWVYPKNVSSAVLELDGPQVISEGEIISVFKKKGKNAKVHLSGKIRYFEEEVQEEGKKDAKVDYSHDF